MSYLSYPGVIQVSSRSHLGKSICIYSHAANSTTNYCTIIQQALEKGVFPSHGHLFFFCLPGYSMSLKFNFVKCDMIIPRFFFCVKFPAKCIWLAAILLMGQNPTLFTSGYFCHHYCIIVEATLFVWDKYTNVNRDVQFEELV